MWGEWRESVGRVWGECKESYQCFFGHFLFSLCRGDPGQKNTALVLKVRSKQQTVEHTCI